MKRDPNDPEGQYCAEEGWYRSMSTGPLHPSITDKAIAILRKREILGYQKYGKPLTPNDGRDTLQDAIEEAADLLQYLVKLKEEKGS